MKNKLDEQLRITMIFHKIGETKRILSYILISIVVFYLIMLINLLQSEETHRLKYEQIHDRISSEFYVLSKDSQIDDINVELANYINKQSFEGTIFSIVFVKNEEWILFTPYIRKMTSSAGKNYEFHIWLEDNDLSEWKILFP